MSAGLGSGRDARSPSALLGAGSRLRTTSLRSLRSARDDKAVIVRSIVVL